CRNRNSSRGCGGGVVAGKENTGLWVMARYGKIGRGACRGKGGRWGGGRVIRKKMRQGEKSGGGGVRGHKDGSVRWGGAGEKSGEHVALQVPCVSAQSRSVESAFFFFQAEDGIRDWSVTGVQTCALPIFAAIATVAAGAAVLRLRQAKPRAFG